MIRLMWCILLAALCMPAFGTAQTSAQPAAAQAAASIPPAKIAWMNMEQAILTCDEGAKLITEIQKFVDGKNSELEALRKEAESLKNQLNVQGPKLTDEARADLEDQVESRDLKLQRFQQDTQKDIENRKARAANYVGNRMQPVIEKISKAKGLSAVFFYNTSRDAWVDPSLNITDEVIKSYNQTYPVASPKAPPTAAPAQNP
jgi:outer membrane protein